MFIYTNNGSVNTEFIESFNIRRSQYGWRVVATVHSRPQSADLCIGEFSTEDEAKIHIGAITHQMNLVLV